MKNKYDSLFNENMTELQASTIMFKTADKIKSKKERNDLLEAWTRNNKKITERELRESAGRMIFTQAVMYITVF